jgi:hypothetical protein
MSELTLPVATKKTKVSIKSYDDNRPIKGDRFLSDGSMLLIRSALTPARQRKLESRGERTLVISDGSAERIWDAAVAAAKFRTICDDNYLTAITNEERQVLAVINPYRTVTLDAGKLRLASAYAKVDHWKMASDKEAIVGYNASETPVAVLMPVRTERSTIVR